MKDREFLQDDRTQAARTEILYLDEDGEPTDKAHAVEWVIRTYGTDGTISREERTGNHGY